MAKLQLWKKPNHLDGLLYAVNTEDASMVSVKINNYLRQHWNDTRDYRIDAFIDLDNLPDVGKVCTIHFTIMAFKKSSEIPSYQLFAKFFENRHKKGEVFR